MKYRRSATLLQVCLSLERSAHSTKRVCCCYSSGFQQRFRTRTNEKGRDSFGRQSRGLALSSLGSAGLAVPGLFVETGCRMGLELMKWRRGPE